MNSEEGRKPLYNPAVYGNQYSARAENGIFKAADAEKPMPPALKTITAAELAVKDIPPLEWLVKDMIPREALCMLAGPPKSYKSFFALDLCVSICTGRPFLNHETDFRNMEEGADHSFPACVYLDLESGERRPRDRMNMILGQDSKKPDNLHFITAENDTAPARVGEGLEEQLLMLCADIPHLALVVIDVLQYVKPTGKRGQNSYENDYEILKALNKVSKAAGVSILVLNHTRKDRSSADVFANISGSTAMTGAVDCSMVIQKDRFESEAVLAMTGRDICSQELRLRFDESCMRWQYVGNADDVQRRSEYENNPITQTVRRLVGAGGEWKGSVEDLKEAARRYGLYIGANAISVGRFLTAHEEEFLMFDGIQYKKGYPVRRKGRSIRLCTFRKVEEEVPDEFLNLDAGEL